MLIKSEVEHIANLARIELNAEEIAKYQQQLGRILDYMEKLKEINISDVKIESEKNILENVWREDDIKTHNPDNKIQVEKLINMAPEVEKGQVKVKSVF